MPAVYDRYTVRWLLIYAANTVEISTAFKDNKVPEADQRGLLEEALADDAVKPGSKSAELLGSLLT